MKRAALLALALPGCLSYGSHLTPYSTPQGELEAHASTDVLVVDRGVGAQSLGQVEVGLRRGLTHDLDVGARLYLAGAGADIRWTVLRRSTWAMAWVFGLSGGFVPVSNRDEDLAHYSLDQSIILGGRPWADFQWTFAGHAHSQLRQGAGKLRFVQVLGASVGTSWMVDDNVWLGPVVGVFAPVDPGREGRGPLSFRGGLSLRIE